MKTKYLFLIILFLTFVSFLLNTSAQDYTGWNLPEGAKARLGKGKITGSIDYSPDGSLLAVASSIGIWIHDAQSGKELDLLIGHVGSVKSVVFSRDGRFLASGSEDGTVRLWDASTGQHLKTLSHIDPVHGVTTVCFSPDSRLLAGSGPFCSISIWNVKSGTLKKEILRSANILTFSPDSLTLASTNHSKLIELFDIVSGKRKKTLRGPDSEVTALVFSLNGRILVSGHDLPASLNLWDAVTGVHFRTITSDSLHSVDCLDLSPNGKVLASGGRLCRIHLWDVMNGTHKKMINIPSTIDDHNTSLVFSPDGHTIAAVIGYGSNTVILLDAIRGTHKKTITGYGGWIKDVVFSPDGHTLVSGNGYVFGDGTLRLWDVVGGEQKKILKGHTGWVKSVVFSPDGKLLASGSTDKTVRVWDAISGAHKRTLTGHQALINSVCFSPDSQLLASGSEDKTVRLWSINSGKHLKTFTGNEDKVTSVCFSPDGQLLASGNADKTVRLWSINSGKHLKTFVGHIKNVTSVCFPADGRTLASGSDDGTVLLWNVDVSMEQTLPQFSQQESTQKDTTPLTTEWIAKTALASTVLIVMMDENGKTLTSGSGFFIGQGLIATNLHVVEKGTRGTFKLVGKDKWHKIKDTIKVDKQHDLVILKVSGIGASALSLGNSNKVRIGQSVYAVGNPNEV